MTADATVKKHSIPTFEAHSVLLVAAIVLAMGLGAAHAQPQDGSAGRTASASSVTTAAAAEAIPPNKVTARDVEAAFRRADRDQDGRLSRAEAEHFPMLSQRFDQADANHDAFLSLGEFNAAAGN